MRIEELRALSQGQGLRLHRLTRLMLIAVFVGTGFAVGAALLFVLPPDDQSELIVAAIAPMALSFTFFRSRS